MGCREGLRFVSVHKLEETLAGLTVSLSVFEKVPLLEKLKVIQLVAMKESLRDLLTGNLLGRKDGCSDGCNGGFFIGCFVGCRRG